MFETNVFGAMEMMRAVLPLMRRAGRGAIVNVISMAGHMALPGNAVYSASKHALIGLTEGDGARYTGRSASASSRLRRGFIRPPAPPTTRTSG